jgi:hypothetical protein
VNKKDATVRNFTTNGSKDLFDLGPAFTLYLEKDNDVTVTNDNTPIAPYKRTIDMFDQEPVDIQAYYDVSFNALKTRKPNAFRLVFGHNDFVFSKSLSLYTPIICHSEKNSSDINLFKNNLYIPVHFWSNAITSRYWYLHYKHLQKNTAINTKRFGCYIRDISGTRKYRKNLLKFLESIQNQVYCPALQTDELISSNASASIPWPDHTKFDIQVIPETIFNTKKVHLTEKTFKPIVMYQPFILFASPNSLKYIQDYGFKTFSNIWDESYDSEPNAKIRFEKATKLIRKIARLKDKDYKILLKKTTNIINFNRKHFYSKKFENRLLDELHSNLNNALEIQEENFYKIPGGTLFHYHDLYYKITGKKLKNYPFLSTNNALQYVNEKSPTVAKEIIKKYNHLL